MSRAIKSESGQSTLEFALSLILLFAFILFYFRLTLVFGFGNYVHYATFMSARAYLSAGPNEADQQARARQVFTDMIESPNGNGARYSVIAKGDPNIGGNPDGLEVGHDPHYLHGERNLSWVQGVRYTFKSRIFTIPLSGSKSGDHVKDPTLTLTSESWLGREPTEEDCLSYMNKGGFTYDNGC